MARSSGRSDLLFFVTAIVLSLVVISSTVRSRARADELPEVEARAALRGSLDREIAQDQAAIAQLDAAEQIEEAQAAQEEQAARAAPATGTDDGVRIELHQANGRNTLLLSTRGRITISLDPRSSAVSGEVVSSAVAPAEIAASSATSDAPTVPIAPPPPPPSISDAADDPAPAPPVGPPSDCSLLDSSACPAVGQSLAGVGFGFDLEVEQLRGLTPSSVGNGASSDTYGSNGPKNAPTSDSAYQVVPYLRLEGQNFGLSIAPSFEGLIGDSGGMAISMPIRAELHHRFGWFDPSIGTEAFISLGDPVATELEGRAALRAYLTPNFDVAGWAEQTLAGTEPVSGIGFSIGGFWG